MSSARGPIVAQRMQSGAAAMRVQALGMGEQQKEEGGRVVLAGAARPPPWSWCAFMARHDR